MMSERNSTPAFAAKDYSSRDEIRVEHIEPIPGAHAVQCHGDIIPSTQRWKFKGWLVEWKMNGGQTAYCYMINEPDVRNFKGGATITKLYEPEF